MKRIAFSLDSKLFFNLQNETNVTIAIISWF